MTINFNNIEYLKQGNPKQRRAYEVLTRHTLLQILSDYDPILVGTIPINIDIDSSDLDLICFVNDLVQFKQLLEKQFGHYKGFMVKEKSEVKPKALLASFIIDEFIVEIFGQDIPTNHQNAYRHMVVEHKLLQQYGEPLREKIVELKKQGYKTEPAFGFALGIKGDPYQELLKM